MKLLKYKKITGEIEVKTGLHIGGSAERIEIGGNDNPVITNPISGEPYIPGSSLKGKMRSLMEWKLGKIMPDGKTHECKAESKAVDCPVCRIFGIPVNSRNPFTKLGPTRLIVRDAEITDECRKGWMDEGNMFTELKYENSLNRVTAVANPRPLERVVAGVRFKLDLVFKVFDIDDGGAKDEECFKYVKKALKMVEDDALGGAGSRGCGKVSFINLKDEDGNDITL